MEPTTTRTQEAKMADPTTRATRQAADAWAAYQAAELAADSAVYDLRAYDAAVPAGSRYVALAREGLVGHYADPEVANLAALNRKAAGR